jgi:hypothetical protein
MRVFLTGGTGQIGTRLIKRLVQRGDEVIVLTRDKQRAEQRLLPTLGDTVFKLSFTQGDPMQAGHWMPRVNGCDAVINLASENLFARRWNEAFKQQLVDSRLKSTRHVVQAIEQAPNKPDVLVHGTAIGYYGMPGDKELTEESPAGSDFLARLCVQWEAAASGVEAMGSRLVLLRSGVVFDKTGGALAKMLTPFKLFVGGKTGSGRQWVSWIHHEDEVGLILFALDHATVRGPLNATAPHPATNRDVAKAIGAAMGRPSFFPTPGFMLRLGLGEVSQLVLGSQKVLPKKALALGYKFKQPEVAAALREILAKR